MSNFTLTVNGIIHSLDCNGPKKLDKNRPFLKGWAALKIKKKMVGMSRGNRWQSGQTGPLGAASGE